ncbi:hypothetical protein [Chroococcidiopsis sp.]|uniref:hypothetical protein n=1 Tax=Chroococcidiopsis sp. TaxID=3088168 RepID=UPI003F370E10
MAIASRIDSFVAPTLTQQSVYDGIKQAFSNAGFTVVHDEFTSGADKVVVYVCALDTAKAYGVTYLRIRLTTGFVIGQQLYSTWSIATHTGTNPSTEITYTALIANTQINFTALNGAAEFKLIMLTQGVNAIALGFVAPANKPAWWDLNAWNYCFIATSNTFAAFRSTNLNPYSNSDNDSSLNVSRMATANVQTNRRDLLPGIIFYTQTNQGISGRTSDDLVMIAGSGTTRYDTIQIPGDTKQYLLLNPTSGGLAVRIS